jgi:hypothetical protein
MDDKQYHLHVDYDRSRLKRESKVYINDYSGDKDGLDLFKDFYDLSLVSASEDGYTVTDGKITAATGTANTNLVDHVLLVHLVVPVLWVIHLVVCGTLDHLITVSVEQAILMSYAITLIKIFRSSQSTLCGWKYDRRHLNWSKGH